MTTIHVLWVSPKDYEKSKSRKGWTLREIPYWMLGLDPGVLFKQCLQRPDGVIVACKGI